MTSPMLEKAARAHTIAYRRRLGATEENAVAFWDHLVTKHPAEVHNLIVALAEALVAIREPDEAMRRALNCDGPFDREDSAVPWKWAWQTGIDAILGETPKP